MIFFHIPQRDRHGHMVTVARDQHPTLLWDPFIPPVSQSLHDAHIASHLSWDGLPPEDGDEWDELDAHLLHEYRLVSKRILRSGSIVSLWQHADGCLIGYYVESRERRQRMAAAEKRKLREQRKQRAERGNLSA